MLRLLGLHAFAGLGRKAISAVGAFVLVSYFAWPVVAGLCKCEFGIPGVPGVKIIHCAANCSGNQQCCACGELSSQCRCCDGGSMCDNTAYTQYGIGRAVCVSIPP
jgi:hypothetical protein